MTMATNLVTVWRTFMPYLFIMESSCLFKQQKKSSRFSQSVHQCYYCRSTWYIDYYCSFTETFIAGGL